MHVTINIKPWAPMVLEIPKWNKIQQLLKIESKLSDQCLHLVIITKMVEIKPFQNIFCLFSTVCWLGLLKLLWLICFYNKNQNYN